jgi:type IV pilus assembly protein PilW
MGGMSRLSLIDLEMLEFNRKKAMTLKHSLLFHAASTCHKGFTLVELMVTTLVSGLVVIAIYSAYLAQQRTALAQEQVSQMQQNLRAGLDIMEREIRMAGYDPRRSVGATITTATAGQLIFTMLADDDHMDNDGDGTIDEVDEIETLEYTLYDAYGDDDQDLGRRTPAAIMAVAENIDRLEFNYIMEDGTDTLTPATLADIRSVRVSILARANTIDPNFTNATTYTTASGASWAFNDHYRRRLLITTIHCRNMGL